MTNAAPQGKDSILSAALADALPKDSCYTAWHISTTPGLTEALCYPPALNSTSERRPSKPLKTYCEKHFLAVSIADPTTAQDVLVLGLEIYIYTTSFSTTIFVAKADSTGYLHLQSSPNGFSPIRAITAAFLNFLVQRRRRPSKQLVINLFARAQSQYIFPGSVNNSNKHILDDGGLIKWWCRVLNPLLEHHLGQNSARDWHRIHGYLVIPGLDAYEARAFVPKTEYAERDWSLRHPLELISPYAKDTASYGIVPPRCLIPTYPDDPKARFIQELEESTSERAKLLGGWKSPRSLDQFWEMMAFRQECSSGRMTGFVWLVFQPPLASTSLPMRHVTATASNPTTSVPTPSASSTNTLDHADQPLISTDPHIIHQKLADTKLLRRKRRNKTVLKGPIISREPRVKTNRVKFPDRIETPHYYWPEEGRGKVILDSSGYTRAVELLLHLEFKSLEQAIASTSRWVGEVNMGENWALPVTGGKMISNRSDYTRPSTTVNDLSGSIEKKRKSDDEASKVGTPTPVNTLSGGLVRKRMKG